VLTWVVVPIYVVLASLVVPFLRTTCAGGASFWTFIPIVLLELHHLHAESVAWSCMKCMTSPPELCILRQFGVLRHRASLILLSMLESVDLFTDFMFPFVALACDDVLTDPWIVTWRQVPVGKHVIPHVLHYLRFWGCAACICAVNWVVTGVVGMQGMRRHEKIRERWFNEQSSDDVEPRLSGQVYFGWARSASTAMLPSVVAFCEAMADQRKWVFEGKDAKTATQGREKLVFGTIDQSTFDEMGLQNLAEQQRLQTAAEKHYIKMLVAKVFFGNVISLWLQSSFLALTFHEYGGQARGQVIFSMLVSGVTALVRSARITGRLGGVGLVLSTFIAAFILWTSAKVYFAYKCTDHLWNITTGCVHM